MNARTILITGGARSGKSAFAESLFQPQTEVVYLATARIDDDEMRERVKRHQQLRPSNWPTIERTYELHAVCDIASPVILLDCISVLTSNIMFDATENQERIPPDVQQQVEDAVIKELEQLITAVREKHGMLVMVTNEVGDAIVPDNHVARVYRDILGRVNQRIAVLCDEVYLVTCGIPLQLK